MDWRRGLVVACALVLVAVAVMVNFSNRRTMPPAQPAATPQATEPSVRGTTVPAPRPSPPRHAEPAFASPVTDDRSSITLRATLLPSNYDTGEFRAEARIGVAEIAREDIAETLAWIADGKEGAGPQSGEELANVRAWIPAPVQPDGRGGGIVGPVEVPPAFSYRILAWLEDGSFYWKESRVRSDNSTSGTHDAGEIAVTDPTGLYLRLVNNVPGESTYAAQLWRAVDPGDAERVSSLVPVVQHAAPRLADALLEGDSLLVQADAATRLAPLVPDIGLTITLSTLAGVRAQPVFVPLQEGVVKTVDVDVGRLFGRATTDTLRLVGTLYAGQTSTPLAGVVMEREAAQLPGTQQTGDDGGFVFSGIPRGEVSRFSAGCPDTSGSRPLGPAHREFVFDPSQCATASSPGECRVEWYMPVYQWIVADVSADKRDALSLLCREPYPVYFLQRRSETGHWVDSSSDQFLLEENGVAVSVTGEGDYRVALAHSPVHVVFSETVHVTPEDGERTARIDMSARPPETRSFRIVSGAGKSPVSGATVEILGPHGSLPPMVTRSSPDGMVEIGPAGVERATVTIGVPGSEPVTHELPLQPGMEIEI